MESRRELLRLCMTGMASSAGGYLAGRASGDMSEVYFEASRDTRCLAQLGAALRNGHLPLPPAWYQKHDEITAKHNQQTVEDVMRLKKKVRASSAGPRSD